MAKDRVTIRPKEEGAFPAFSTSEPATCIAGKSDDCQLVILGNVDGGISRHHCLFDINPPYVTLKDLGSKNGVYVNNRRVTEEFLHDGDRIALGTIVLIFRNPKDLSLFETSSNVSS